MMWAAGWTREFWDYRELFFFMVWRDVKIRYKQTILGAAWAVIQPFLTMVVFTLFFGKLAGMEREITVPYPIFSFSAVLPWTYFSGALRYSGNSLIENANLIRKVYFPRAILPASSTLSGLVDFTIASVILVGMMVYYRVPVTWRLLLCPIVLIPIVVLALSVGMILAALNVRYRDVKHAIPFIIQLWLFVTPIIYPSSILKGYAPLMALNPLGGLIEAFRGCLIPGTALPGRSFLISLAITGALFLIGAVYFRRAEREFADTI